MKKPVKVILYRLAKKMNKEFHIISSCTENRSRTDLEKKSDKMILLRLKKKGLVGMSKYKSGNIYYLTDEGDKIAKPIVDEIDEYKRW